MQFTLRTLLIGGLRIILAGLIAGGVWTLMSAILLALIGGEFLAVLPSGQPAVRKGGVPFEFLANFAAGVWVMWLYSAIRPRYASGTRTAFVAGVAWWVIVSFQSAKWVSLLSIPLHTVAGPMAATLPAMIVATAIGGWFYEEREATKEIDYRPL